MMLNLHLRTAHRVLFELASFRATHPDAVYRTLRALPWESYIPADGFVSIDSFVRTTAIRDQRFANMKCKDAIVDRIRQQCGRRPDSGPGPRGVCVFLYWKDAAASVYLNTSGEPLTKRGYRHIPWKAPLGESLAAALIMASEWAGDSHFVNPMCGSGTLAIEAALLAMQKAPGLLRPRYAFQHILGFDDAAWQALRRAARQAARPRPPGRIVANDSDPHAIEAARHNAETAGVAQWIEFAEGDFAVMEVPAGPGVVMLNPPYGERLGEAEALERTYGHIGDFFKQRCAGYRGCIFTGNLDLARRVGLRTQRRITFFNGPIECRLLVYDLYAGTRRPPPAPEADRDSAAAD